MSRKKSPVQLFPDKRPQRLFYVEIESNIGDSVTELLAPDAKIAAQRALQMNLLKPKKPGLNRASIGVQVLNAETSKVTLYGKKLTRTDVDH